MADEHAKPTQSIPLVGEKKEREVMKESEHDGAGEMRMTTKQTQKQMAGEEALKQKMEQKGVRAVKQKRRRMPAVRAKV